MFMKDQEWCQATGYRRRVICEVLDDEGLYEHPERWESCVLRLPHHSSSFLYFWGVMFALFLASYCVILIRRRALQHEQERIRSASGRGAV
jgi:hypothetical protein